MPKPLPNLVACPDCDALYHRRALAPGEKARCGRCGATLYKAPGLLTPDRLMALVVAALICIAIANTMPIVQLSAGGITHATSLIGAIGVLWAEDRGLTAMLAFATALAFPLIELCALLAVLVAIRTRPGAPFVATLLRSVQAVRPWGMIEVFMLGLVVALVKISKTAQVVPGVALWAFAALTVLLALIVSYDLRQLWSLRRVEERK